MSPPRPIDQLSFGGVGCGQDPYRGRAWRSALGLFSGTGRLHPATNICQDGAGH